VTSLAWHYLTGSSRLSALLLGMLFALVRFLTATTGAQTRVSKMSLYPGRATFMVGSVAQAASPRPPTRIGRVCLAVLILFASGPTALATLSRPSLGISLSSVGDRPENPAGPASARRMPGSKSVLLLWQLISEKS
jgi:hypothetical protein